MALMTDFAGIDAGTRTAETKLDYSRYRIVPARHPGRLVGTIFAAAVRCVSVDTSDSRRDAAASTSVHAGTSQRRRAVGFAAGRSVRALRERLLMT